MKQVYFSVVETHNNYGLLQEGLKKIEIIDPIVDGNSIAHDNLDHLNGVSFIGRVDDEMEALGASWFIRGQYGDLSRKKNISNIYKVYSSEIYSLMSLYIHNPEIVLKQPSIIDNDYIRETFSHILSLSQNDLIAYTKYATLFENELARAEDFLKISLNLMLSGFEKAETLYQNGIFANNLFWSIVDAVDETIRGGRNLEPYGKYCLTFDPSGVDTDSTKFEIINQNDDIEELD